MPIKRTSLCILGLFLALNITATAAPSANPAAAAEKSRPSQVTLDFKDVELTDLIQTISEMTGKNFIYDDTVKGKVTIVSPRGMSMNEAYQVFLSVLNVKGYAIVPIGKANKIVRNQEAKENSLPTGAEATSSGAEQYVTRLVPLRYIDATTLATSVLAPLVPKSSSVVPYPPSNTLIITDSGANIERLLKIIAELDVPSTGERLEMIFLEYASADEVAQIGSQVLAQTSTSARGSRPGAAAGATAASSKVIPFARANAVIVMAEAADLEMIRALIKGLDRKQEAARSNINVCYLENANAETLAKTMTEIITGARAKPAKAGQPAAASSEPSTITADKATNSLIVSATPEEYETLRGIVKQLDIKRKQVFVEALILELSMDATQKLGVSLSGAGPVGSSGGVFAGMNQPIIPSSDLLTQSVDGIMAGGFTRLVNFPDPFNPGKTIQVPALSALINLSKTDSDVNIVSAPRLLTSDNEEAEIIVGSNVPIITSRLTNAVGSSTPTSNGLATSVSVERKDVALTLRFTPQITEGNLVRLKIYQEITDIAKSSADVGDVSQVGPSFTKRLLQNTVVAEDGKTVVLGGLIGNNSQEVITKVPLLGDIPLIGWLFKRKTTVEKKTNLLIFITPHIIRNSEDLSAITRDSHDAMNRFQQTEMQGALKKNRFGSEAMEKIAQQSQAESPDALVGPPSPFPVVQPETTTLPVVPQTTPVVLPESAAPTSQTPAPVAPEVPQNAAPPVQTIAPPEAATPPTMPETTPHE